MARRRAREARLAGRSGPGWEEDEPSQGPMRPTLRMEQARCHWQDPSPGHFRGFPGRFLPRGRADSRSALREAVSPQVGASEPSPYFLIFSISVEREMPSISAVRLRFCERRRRTSVM